MRRGTYTAAVIAGAFTVGGLAWAQMTRTPITAPEAPPATVAATPLARCHEDARAQVARLIAFAAGEPDLQGLAGILITAGRAVEEQITGMDLPTCLARVEQSRAELAELKAKAGK